MKYKSKRSRATDIPQSVKKIVWERDNHQCVICGSPYAMPNAHYISRAQGGLGIEQNIVTLCGTDHYRYDNGDKRAEYAERIREYLKGKYPDWDESKLYYKKWSD